MGNDFLDVCCNMPGGTHDVCNSPTKEFSVDQVCHAPPIT